MNMTNVTPDDVLHFWFEELGWDDWFIRSDDLDARITERFRTTHLAMSRGERASWAETPDGALASTIVLDQFPRNMYRGSPMAFATDNQALALANTAVRRGFDQKVPVERRIFFYMPFEHSERLEDQDRSVSLIGPLGDARYLGYAEKHRDVIRLYGRFPHRNAILGRLSTPEELTYLSEPGAGF